MQLKHAPELLAFLSKHLSDDADPGADAESARTFAAATATDRVQATLTQAKSLLAQNDLPLEEIGTHANRWFGESQEARAWLQGIVAALDSASGVDRAMNGDVTVKDSNGAPLLEGDSVQVIKDLKVKGGTSDLKRGTLIKKIHLIGDPDNIECRVDGSTLVLKTCFLKKA